MYSERLMKGMIYGVFEIALGKNIKKKNQRLECQKIFETELFEIYFIRLMLMENQYT